MKKKTLKTKLSLLIRLKNEGKKVKDDKNL